MFRIVLVFLVAVFTATSIQAQVQAGRIVGTVFDSTKSAVPGAAITVTEIDTNLVHRVTANTNGDYVVTPLNPGSYKVSVSASGFQTLLKNNIELQVGQVARVDADLVVGDTVTTVEVSADVPLLDTDSATLGQVINNQQIVNLPLNGRSFYELARLTPGAVLLPGTGNVLRIRPEFINGTAISGVRGRMITFLMDGVDISEQHQGGTFIQTSIDALQEFKVQQNGYSAEFSRAGGMLNATTKAGSNQFHGTAFEFLRNDKLDARNFFARNREILKRNQFGGVLSGPLKIPKLSNGKAKMFFLLSYEAMRERQGLVFNNLVPTVAMKQGDFSARGLNALFDPLTTSGTTRTPFAGNIIPQDRLSPQAQFLNKFVADPNTAAGTASLAPSRQLDQDQFTVRVDRNFTENHKLFVRWSWHDNRQNDPNAYPALGIAPLSTRANNVAASFTSNFSTNWIHEFRYNHLASNVQLLAFLQGTDVNGQAGIRGFDETKRPGVAGAFPDIAWSGYTSMNGSAFDQRPKTQDRWVEEITDSLTFIKGRNIFKFGGKVRYFKPLFTDSKQFVGQWNFSGINTENPGSPTGTGNAFADWMLGYAASATRAFPGDVFGGQNTYYQFFFNDDLKATRKLTLNIGLRYEYTPWLKGYKNQVGTFDGTSAKPVIIAGEGSTIDLKAQFAAPTAYPLFQDIIQTSSQAGLPLAISYTDKNQWAPRFGFAYRAFGDHTVFRGGYGIFYETENSDGRVNLNMVPFKLDETAFNDRGVTPTRPMSNYFLGRPLSLSAAPGISPTYVRMRMGYDQHWNFGVQHQFQNNMMFEVDYVGNRGAFLNSSNAFNDPAAAVGNVQARRPYPRFGSSGYNAQDMSNKYHSLQLKTEKRLSSGLWYLVSYTFSKTMDHQNVPVKGYNTYSFEQALSDFDIPHNIALSFGYGLPFGKGKQFAGSSGRFVDAFIGGWQTQGIFNWHSGRPFTPTVSRDVANIGRGGQRPNRIGSGVATSPTLDLWFDKSAFVVPANFNYGNSGGRILREDAIRFFDFSMFKVFRITERQKLEFRGEFFNLTNTASFLNPNTDIDTAAGGRVTATSNIPRQIQFGMKYSF